MTTTNDWKLVPEYSQVTQSAKKVRRVRKRNISLLLGAGFSMPMGYPSGKKINELFLNMPNETRNYTLCIGRTTEESRYDFLIYLITEYSKTKDFDYEEFYDFLESDEIQEAKYQELAKDHLAGTQFDCFINDLRGIYNRLIAQLIKDRNGNLWYEKKSFDVYKEYETFIYCLHQWCQKCYVNVHTLNHDLLFESFNNHACLKDKISDGFSEFGSKFLGELNCYGQTYKVRLAAYTGKRNTSIRLYKLHGSLDYVEYYSNCRYNTHVKLRDGVRSDIVFRSTRKNVKDEEWPFVFNADFLTGTTSKLNEYKKPFYNELLHSFKDNLRKSDVLIIIGYGGKDVEINRIIQDNFDFKTKEVVIVNPDNSTPENIFYSKFSKSDIPHLITYRDLKEFTQAQR